MFLAHTETIPQALRALADMTEGKIADMQAKADEAFPKPQPLKPFPKKSVFLVPGAGTLSIDHSSSWWDFKDGWGSAKPISSLTSLESRKNALLEQVAAWEVACANIEEANKPLIENNLLIKHKMAQIMKQLGIPDSYQERDTNSRARTPKSVTKTAGWICDLSRNIPTTQYTAHKSEAQQMRSRIEDTYRTAYRTIYDQEQKTQKEKTKVENETKVAFYKVKYGCDPLADSTDVLYAVLSKCKYLRLAYYLEQNRNDWTEGYDYAEQGIGGFSVETEEDKEIEKCISEIIAEADKGIDGRHFRDCEYNYGVLYAKVDADLYADYEQVKQMTEKT